jgi:hypothetical protein
MCSLKNSIKGWKMIVRIVILICGLVLLLAGAIWFFVLTGKISDEYCKGHYHAISLGIEQEIKRQEALHEAMIARRLLPSKTVLFIGVALIIVHFFVH